LTPFFKRLFLLLNELVIALETATRAGTSFVFGYLGGGTAPFLLQNPGANFILAFQALPLVLVIGALSGLLLAGTFATCMTGSVAGIFL
jgi:concentrative nucleoside transporter, CNT family